MAAGYRVQGLDRLVRDLRAMGLEVEDLKDAFSTIAHEAQEVIAAAAPRRSGRLAADVRGNRARSKAVVTAGRASIPYAGPINYGWPSRGIKAASFMQAADREYSDRAVLRLEQEINRQIHQRGLT